MLLCSYSAPLLHVSFTTPGVWHQLQHGASSASSSCSSAAGAAGAASSTSPTGIALFYHQTFAATVFVGLFVPTIGRYLPPPPLPPLPALPPLLLLIAVLIHSPLFTTGLLFYSRTGVPADALGFIFVNVLHAPLLHCVIVTFCSCAPRAAVESLQLELLRSDGQANQRGGQQ